MEYLNIILSETYKILFLLVPVLVSVAMIVWLDRRIWAFVQKDKDQMLWDLLVYYSL